MYYGRLNPFLLAPVLVVSFYHRRVQTFTSGSARINIIGPQKFVRTLLFYIVTIVFQTLTSLVGHFCTTLKRLLGCGAGDSEYTQIRKTDFMQKLKRAAANHANIHPDINIINIGIKTNLIFEKLSQGERLETRVSSGPAYLAVFFVIAPKLIANNENYHANLCLLRSNFSFFNITKIPKWANLRH